MDIIYIKNIYHYKVLDTEFFNDKQVYHRLLLSPEECKNEDLFICPELMKNL